MREQPGDPLHDELHVGPVVVVHGRVVRHPDDLGPVHRSRKVRGERERPPAMPRRTSSSSPGSKMGGPPAGDAPTVPSSKSSPTTSWPAAARHAAVTVAEVPEPEDADVHARASSTQGLACR